MKALVLAAVAVMGCGPFAPNVVGRTCDAGALEQHCASPTSYAACESNIWREYPCAECSEGGKCDLSAVKAGEPCAWPNAGTCKSPRLAVFCVGGKWEPHTCDECLGPCLACTCK